MKTSGALTVYSRSCSREPIVNSKPTDTTGRRLQARTALHGGYATIYIRPHTPRLIRRPYHILTAARRARGADRRQISVENGRRRAPYSIFVNTPAFAGGFRSAVFVLLQYSVSVFVLNPYGPRLLRVSLNCPRTIEIKRKRNGNKKPFQNCFLSRKKTLTCSAPPDPLAGLKGPTSKRREERKRGRGGRGGEGTGGTALPLRNSCIRPC